MTVKLVITAAAADIVLVGVLAIKHRPDRTGLRRVNSLDTDRLRIVVGVGLVDLRKRQLCRLEILFDPCDRIVGLGVDSLFHLYLQDEVNAPLKIEAEVNVLRQLADQRTDRRQTWVHRGRRKRRIEIRPGLR